MPERPVRGTRGTLVYLRPREPSDAALVHGWYEDSRISTLMGDLPRSLAWRTQRYESSPTAEGSEAYLFVICRLDDDVTVGGGSHDPGSREDWSGWRRHG